MTPEILSRLTALITPGLVSGLGKDAPGGMCIEAAVSLATTGVFGDMPPCVAEPDRAYAICINDSRWSSPQARAEALLPLAIAQIGTAGTYRAAWVRRVAEGTIRRVLPVILRTAAAGAHDVAHREALEAAALRCETGPTGSAASVAATAAYAFPAYAARAAAYAAASANSAATPAYAARAAAHAAAYAAAYTAADDDVLRLSVQVALDAYAAEGVA